MDDTAIVDAAGCEKLASFSVVSGWALPKQMEVSTLGSRYTCLKFLCWPMFARRRRLPRTSCMALFGYYSSSILFSSYQQRRRESFDSI